MRLEPPLVPNPKPLFSTQPPELQAPGLPHHAHILGFLPSHSYHPSTIQPPIFLPTHSSTLNRSTTNLPNQLTTYSPIPQSHSNHASTTQVHTYLSIQTSKYPPFLTQNLPSSHPNIHSSINCMFTCLSSPLECKFHEDRSPVCLVHYCFLTAQLKSFRSPQQMFIQYI